MLGYLGCMLGYPGCMSGWSSLPFWHPQQPLSYLKKLFPKTKPAPLGAMQSSTLALPVRRCHVAPALLGLHVRVSKALYPGHGRVMLGLTRRRGHLPTRRWQ